MGVTPLMARIFLLETRMWNESSRVAEDRPPLTSGPLKYRVILSSGSQRWGLRILHLHIGSMSFLYSGDDSVTPRDMFWRRPYQQQGKAVATCYVLAKHPSAGYIDVNTMLQAMFDEETAR